jgi:enediyne biosynthesis protein E4
MNVRRISPAFVAFLIGMLPVFLQAAEAEDCSIRLVDVSSETGISFRHNHGGSGQGYIVEGMVAGLVLFDYDNDGWIDIYFLNGAELKGTVLDSPPGNALYRNNGNWTFTDVTEKAGVGDQGFGLGVTAGDYDNDGDQDLYLNNFGPNVLYRNNGDGTFADVTDEAGVGNGDKVGAGACFLDMEGDGDLDLYSSNYVNFTYENHVPIMIGGHTYQAGPQYYHPVPDTLYRNNGDGTFTDVSGPSGIGSHAGPGMGTVCGDFDDDGDSDVFVCHDGAANFLFVNDGHGKFTESGLMAGVAYDFEGKDNSSMGVDCGDYNNDGRLDLFMTDYQVEMPVLYRNLGNGLFEDATSTAGITNDLYPHVNWGTAFADFDNDGDRDIFIACGHFDRIEKIDDRTALKIPNFLLMNLGDGKFVNVSRRCGNGLEVVESSRGIGLDDLDNDGDLDVVVLNSHAPPTILRNESEGANHWLQVKLEGAKSNRGAVGARVKVVAGDLVQVAEVHSGRGYQSHFGSRLQFGLGSRANVDRIEVRWPSGNNEIFPGIKLGEVSNLREGTSPLGE